MKHIYRLANNDDLEHFIYLDKQMRIEEPDTYFDYEENTYRENWVKHPIDSNDFGDVVLCLNDKEVVGRIDLICERSYMDFSLVGYIDWIYVRPNYRGKGIGKLLFAEAEKYFKLKGCFKYYLFVAENEQAKKFYEGTDLTIKDIKKAQKKIS